MESQPTEDMDTTRKEDVTVSSIGDSSAAEVRALSFFKLLAGSSLGTATARDNRLVGAKEIESHPAGRATLRADISAADQKLDLDVAAQLELCGYTFEAELLYRKIAAEPAAASRLALMLEAKGFQSEAWHFYLWGAQANDTNSLLRLAVICRQRGVRWWATRLAQQAGESMREDVHGSVLDNLQELAGYRHLDRLGRRLTARAVDEHDVDTTYALGSMFFVHAGRADLARLAFCSALSRGHSLAAVSLLDMPPRHQGVLPENGNLQAMLDSSIELRDVDRANRHRPGSHALERSTAVFQSSMQSASLQELCEAVDPRNTGGEGTDRADAVERVLLTTRVVTTLRGLARQGCRTGTLRAIHNAADQACTQAERAITDGRAQTAASLGDVLWETGDAALRAADLLPSSGPGAPDAEEIRKRRTISSGTVGRLRRAFHALPGEERKVLVLRLAGLYPEETALVMHSTLDRSQQMYRQVQTRLREEQQGEQIDHELWTAVESCFGESSDLDDQR